MTTEGLRKDSGATWRMVWYEHGANLIAARAIESYFWPSRDLPGAIAWSNRLE